MICIGGPSHFAPSPPDDASRLAELDRSEPVAMVYAVRDGEIVPLGHGEEIPQWSGAWLDGVIAFARRHLESGGTGVAAFDGDQLAGVAVLGGEPVGDDPQKLPLAILHVGRGHRRRGVASLLFREMREEAARRGARRLYISATPSEGALRFYLGQGARLADPPDPGARARAGRRAPRARAGRLGPYVRRGGRP